MVRALLDADVLISSLLGRGGSAPVLTVGGALDGTYSLLLPGTVIVELHDRALRKPSLSSRIPETAADRLVAALRLVAVPLPEQRPPFPPVCRDPRDDYLFAHAQAGRADYLVSGDREVLTVGRVGGVEVVSPAEFVALLGLAGDA